MIHEWYERYSDQRTEQLPLDSAKFRFFCQTDFDISRPWTIAPTTPPGFEKNKYSSSSCRMGLRVFAVVALHPFIVNK